MAEPVHDLIPKCLHRKVRAAEQICARNVVEGTRQTKIHRSEQLNREITSVTGPSSIREYEHDSLSYRRSNGWHTCLDPTAVVSLYSAIKEFERALELRSSLIMSSRREETEFLLQRYVRFGAYTRTFCFLLRVPRRAYVTIGNNERVLRLNISESTRNHDVSEKSDKSHIRGECIR